MRLVANPRTYGDSLNVPTSVETLNSGDNAEIPAEYVLLVNVALKYGGYDLPAPNSRSGFTDTRG
jgi:hypothetical protein